MPLRMAAVCYMAQAPLLPYLTKQLGADDLGYGWLQSAFSTLQFLGGLLSGVLAASIPPYQQTQQHPACVADSHLVVGLGCPQCC